MSRSIPIFLATDENYLRYCAVTIFSILANTKENINFYILDGGVSESSKHRLKKSLIRYSNVAIEFLNLSNINISIFPNIKHYSRNTFLRYYIPQLKPELKKVIYLDCDIIVNKDIKNLYECDIASYPIGAVLEDFYVNNYTNLLTIAPYYKAGSKYFNAGMLLIDIQIFEKGKYFDKIYQKTMELKDRLFCADQDVLNIVFENNFKVLDYKYNFMPDLFENLKKHKNFKNKFINECTVYHYVAGKPWFNKSIKSKLFWKYAIKTPFYLDLKLNLFKFIFTNFKNKFKKFYVLLNCIYKFNCID